VVAVFVGDENGRQVFQYASNAGEAQANLARTEPGIHQHARLAGFQVGAIAGGTAAENGQVYSHSRTVEMELKCGNHFQTGATGSTVEKPLKRLDFIFSRGAPG
jgi:hypothetical protein